jgi:hypothetical protein
MIEPLSIFQYESTAKCCDITTRNVFLDAQRRIQPLRHISVIYLPQARRNATQI